MLKEVFHLPLLSQFTPSWTEHQSGIASEHGTLAEVVVRFYTNVWRLKASLR